MDLQFSPHRLFISSKEEDANNYIVEKLGNTLTQNDNNLFFFLMALQKYQYHERQRKAVSDERTLK